MAIGSKRLEKFPEYIFSRLAKATAEVEKDSGRKVLNFGAGSPDIPPSQSHITKLKEFLDDPKAHLYPGYVGIPEFNEALCTWYKKRFNVELTTDEVLPLLGGKDGIAHLPLAFTDAGDEVLSPNPGYPPFSEPALMYDVTPVYYDLLPENEFKPSLDALEKLVTPRTRYLWINYPSNPTGAVVTLEELADLVGFAKKHALLVIYDNAYAEITFDGFVAPSILQIPGAKDFCVEIGSFSKTFSFAGFRMGWVVGNKEAVAAVQKVKSQIDSGMALPLQRVGAYALLNRDDKWHAAMLASYKERRDSIAAKLKKLGLTFDMPKGSLYIWAKIPDAAKDSETFAMELLREKQVLVTPGTAYGSNGSRYVRISICVDISNIDQYL